MNKYLKYLSYVLRHKYYVFIECCKYGELKMVWRGLVHDISKLTPAEFFPYVNKFYGRKLASIHDFHGEARNVALNMRDAGAKFAEDVQADFDLAWLYHQKRNKHHWQFFVLLNDNPSEDYKVTAPAGDNLAPYFISSRYNEELAVCDEHLNSCRGMTFGEASVMCVTLAKTIVNKLNRYPIAIPMPDTYRKEMLADWRGAGKAINGKDDTKSWYLKNKDNMILHPDTREWIEDQLEIE